MFGLIKNRKHENVGRRLYSEYLKSDIEVVAFNRDDKWWFCLVGTNGSSDYREFRAGSKLSWFEENGKEIDSRHGRKRH